MLPLNLTRLVDSVEERMKAQKGRIRAVKKEQRETAKALKREQEKLQKALDKAAAKVEKEAEKARVKAEAKAERERLKAEKKGGACTSTPASLEVTDSLAMKSDSTDQDGFFEVDNVYQYKADATSRVNYLNGV